MKSVSGTTQIFRASPRHQVVLARPHVKLGIACKDVGAKDPAILEPFERPTWPAPVG